MPTQTRSNNSLFICLVHMHSVTYFHKGDLEAYLSPENYQSTMSHPTPYQIVVVAPLFNLLFFTSAPSTTLPRSNFSDKTPQGRWVLTKVTHASATFKANHNSALHLKGCFTNFVLFKCTLRAVFEVSPSEDCSASLLRQWSQTVSELLQRLRW